MFNLTPEINPTEYQEVPPGEVEFLIERLGEQEKRSGAGQLAAIGIGAMLNHLAHCQGHTLDSLAKAAGVHPIWLAMVLHGLILPEEAEQQKSITAFHKLGKALKWVYHLWPVKSWENLLPIG
ncbi:MAG: hypothetical protein A2700_02070 [Candidatus Blackburnbacteria bacterium RIFCSPHIGHO2_01_FULL_44_64]|nr:MAG: hypothetical protein A2700_02070 [Candidatus Blackburnbacteria bacterium RIFCSPHIGHO2_01_FULL_44_64]OGY11190.1 MAG: hypothetical protein A3E16_00300 [Candidatus Blackburnbacteria bacterium RIFCSPHIGHO2_12_FULL_44_25]